MAIEFEQKKTIELSDEDMSQIVGLFERVFQRKTTIEVLRRSYISNPLGYSYHSLMKDDGMIVGFTSWEPYYFLNKSERQLYACSVSSMVDNKYRGISNFYKLVKDGYAFLQKEGVYLVYAYPNDNSYPVFIKMKLLKDIGKMRTYCLPYRIGGVKKRLKWLSPLSIICCQIFLCFSKLFVSKQEVHYLIEKDLDTFNKSRYKKTTDYKIVSCDDYSFVYRLYNYEGVKTAFLIDVNPKSSRTFVKAISHIVKEDSQNFDIILYSGLLPFSNTGMIRIPLKYSPKNFNFTAIVLNKEKIGDEVWEINNWDTNLSNYDLI